MSSLLNDMRARGGVMRHNAARSYIFKDRPLMKLISKFGSALIVTAVTAAPAFAALGGDAASVLTDRDRTHGTLHISAAASYSVHEITTASGTTVREYLTPAGKVFGLAWRGPFMPDLRQFLGVYYTHYQQAARAAAVRTSSRHVEVQAPDVVVHSSGRMRAFYGRAWAPALVPQGVSTEDIK